MDYILNDKELLNVNGGMIDETNPYLNEAKEYVLFAFRIAQKLATRSGKIEGELRQVYLDLYGARMNVPLALNKLINLKKSVREFAAKTYQNKLGEDIVYNIDQAIANLEKIK